MSRSTKKPYYTDRNPDNKRRANARVRKHKDVPRGKSYKKVYQSWNIKDWSCEAVKDKKAYRK